MLSQFRCNICNRQYATKNSLKVHQDIHNKSNGYKCKECGALFHTQGSYFCHIRKHTNKGFVCQVCDKVVYHKEKFTRHLRSHSGEQPYECPVCKMKFSHKVNLKRHRALVHNDKTEFQCTKCVKAYASYDSFLDHLQKDHSQRKSYTCRYCGKSLTTSSLLTRHMRTHTGEKPYVCSVCLLPFADSSNLKQHLELHAYHNECPPVLQQFLSTSRLLALDVHEVESSNSGDLDSTQFNLVKLTVI